MLTISGQCGIVKTSERGGERHGETGEYMDRDRFIAMLRAFFSSDEVSVKNQQLRRMNREGLCVFLRGGKQDQFHTRRV